MGLVGTSKKISRLPTMVGRRGAEDKRSCGGTFGEAKPARFLLIRRVKNRLNRLTEGVISQALHKNKKPTSIRIELGLSCPSPSRKCFSKEISRSGRGNLSPL